MNISYVMRLPLPSRAANTIHIVKMCSAFAGLGHEVVLMHPKSMFRHSPGFETVRQYYGIDHPFSLKGFPWISMPRYGVLFSLWAAQCAKVLKTDLFYSRYLPAAAVSSVFGMPTIYEIHQPEHITAHRDRFLFRRMIRQGSLKKIVVISEALKHRVLTDWPVLSDKILVAHDGADLPKKSQAKIPQGNRLRAGYVGHLYPGKGMEVVFELAKICPDFEFHVVGGNDSDLSFWKEKSKGIENLVFHGFVPPSAVEGYRESFDVLLAPFQDKVTIGGKGDVSAWMSPLKIFEYMSAKKPILCSDLPVLREVLDESVAVLLPAGDIQSWKKALESMKHPERRRLFAEAAHERFLKHHTWQARAKRVLDSIRLST